MFSNSKDDGAFGTGADTSSKPCSSGISKERHSSSYGFQHVSNSVSYDDGISACSGDFHTFTSDEWKQCMDNDGRVVDEMKMRESVFNGGCDSCVRADVWGFLFKLYPLNSTKRERQTLFVENALYYQALKNKCSEFLKSGDFSPIVVDEVCASTFDINEDKFQASWQIAQTRAVADSQDIDFTVIHDWFRVVDKDIPRTDIDHPYFHENTEASTHMRNILITFGVYHPKIGYVQGMNDILTRFLIALKSESDAYWCFASYMESVAHDFSETGMVEKMELVCDLLRQQEPNLLIHLENCSVPSLLFCHRWLLVSFKREFEYEESIRYFEIVQSKYLQFDSHTALKVRDEQHRQEVQKNQGKPVSCPTFDDVKYTLDIFVCVSVIMLKRKEFYNCKDASEVFAVACNIRGTLNLKDVHHQAFGLFKKYCRNYTEENSVAVKSTWNSISSFAKQFLNAFNPAKW